MNYSGLRKADIANGFGFRISLWVCGCKRHCKNCFNEEAQDPKFGKRFDKEVKVKIFRELAEPYCDGISFLGGEPLSVCSDNRKQIIQLAKECREKFPEKSQWLYTGYTFEEVLADPEMRPVLNYIDVLVDGRFIESLKDLSLPFRGSSNQRVIAVPQSLSSHSIVEMAL